MAGKMSSKEGEWSAGTAGRIDGMDVIITGGSSGLGARISRILAEKGGQVTIADIDVRGAGTVADEICRSVHGVEPEVRELDLGDLRSVKRFSDAYRAEHDQLGLLVNNAGIMTPPYRKTAQGFESQWGVNHLGHFALTAGLLELLVATPGSRVVVQTSCVHRGGNIRFSDISSERSYFPWRAYKQSKLATLLFARELHRRLDLAGLGSPVCVGSQPGLVNTPLYQNTRLMRWYLRPFMHGIDDGVQPALRACLDPSVKGGEFIGPDGWMEFKGRPVLVQPHNRGRDMELAARVWKLSEEMTGVDLSAIITSLGRR
ncbi:MAG: short chain dehydrogenase [Methanomassiliicoccales archaeon PtaB.Bin215]|nr:MAG: short chain dehydrogenase [Methanomassiliicoccales archaeon PtaB.Bin215]